MLPTELSALVRNVQMLLELESCFPRERLLPADELRALGDVAETAALDEMAQRRIRHAEHDRDVGNRKISPQQAPHFGDTIRELGVELRTRRAVRHEARLHDVAAERGACGRPPHAGTCDLPPRSPAKPCDSAGARSSLEPSTQPTEAKLADFDLKKFDLEYWWKMIAAAGALIVIASIAVKFVPTIFVGLGLLSIGIGEWINHPYREYFDGGPYMLTGHPRLPSMGGLLLDALGVAMAIVGLVKLALA